MERPASGDTVRLHALLDELCRFEEGAPAVLSRILPDVARLLRAPGASAYGVRFDGERFVIDWLYNHGSSPTVLEDARSVLGRLQFRSTFYTPAVPDPRQRNVALTSADLRALTGREMPALFREFMERAGLAGADQLRVLVCDGPALLAWVGSFRQEPFSAHERELLQRLAGPLRQRLNLERLLGREWTESAIHGALDSFPQPAFLLSTSGAIAHANRAAARLPEIEPAAVQSGLHGYLVSELRPRRGARVRFAVQSPEGEATPGLDTAAARWGLSGSEADLADLIVRGHSERSMATAMACARSEVQRRVAALFAKAGVASRDGLLGALASAV
jgi:PAS domain-containing protein